MKISSLSAPRVLRSGGVAASASLMLLMALQTAQAQQPVAPPNGDTNTQWVAVGDQIVPAGAVMGSHARADLSPLSFYPNARKWPQGRVSYTYADNMSASKKAVFESACREWEKYADLHFSPRIAEANYIIVTSTADQSNSAIGMVGNGQVLNLADWANKITAVHELGHALGVIHEQSRPDRDTYVTIHPENITDGMAFNFDKIAGALNQGPYDFDSMMHYYGTAFSKNGQPTITANAGYTQFQYKMGQSDHVSELDKSGMALIYGRPGLNGRGIIKPEYPKTKDILTAKPIGNGAPTDYRYKWLKNYTEIVGQTSNTLDLGVDGNGDKGNLITVIISGPDDTGAQATDQASVKILNSAPTVTPDDPENPLSVLNTGILRGRFTGADDDNDPVSFLLVTQADKGVLKLEASGAFTYTPNADFEGTDGFKVAATDGQSAGLPETFSVKVEQDNKIPVFKDLSLRATLGLEFNAPLGATDENNDELTYSLVDGALPDGLEISSDGSIVGTPTTLQTTHATIRVDDGHHGTADAQMSIEVKPENITPSVRLTFTPREPKTNDTLVVNATINNPVAGDVTTVYRFKIDGKVVQEGKYNKLDLSLDHLGDKGDVISCEVTVTNAKGGSATASAQAAVANSAPVAASGSGNANAGELTSFPLVGRDADGDPIQVKLVGSAANGEASVRTDGKGNTQLLYRSKTGFGGTDVVRFTFSDGSSTSNTANFTIKVQAPPANRAPVASDMTLQTYVGQTVDKILSGSDPDGDAISFRIVSNALYGKAQIKLNAQKLPVLFYTAPDKFHASDRVTYVAVDSKGAQSKLATATFRFVNRAPVAQPGSITVASGETTSQLLVATDADNDALSFRIVGDARNGNAQIKRDAQGALGVYYKSNAGYVGDDRIAFVAIDTAGNQSASAIIKISVVRKSATPSAGAAIQSGAAPSANGS